MNAIYKFIVFFAVLGFSAFSMAEENSIQDVSIGKLSDRYCIDKDSESELNQRFWFARIPPYIGYSKGERTTAGGDGTCYLGYPKEKSDVAVVKINGKIVEVTVTESTKGKATEEFRSKDGKIIIELTIIGNDSTCSPDSESCCGEYTYATITAIYDNKKSTVNAAKYEGG